MARRTWTDDAIQALREYSDQELEDKEIAYLLTQRFDTKHPFSRSSVATARCRYLYPKVPPKSVDVPLTPFAALLRSSRMARGWSMSELARRTGLDHSYISRLESGERGPGRDVVTAIADAFGVRNVDRGVLYALAGHWPDNLPVVPTALLAYLLEADGIEDIETEAA